MKIKESKESCSSLSVNNNKAARTKTMMRTAPLLWRHNRDFTLTRLSKVLASSRNRSHWTATRFQRRLTHWWLTRITRRGRWLVMFRIRYRLTCLTGNTEQLTHYQEEDSCRGSSNRVNKVNSTMNMVLLMENDMHLQIKSTTRNLWLVRWVACLTSTAMRSTMEKIRISTMRVAREW